MTTESLPSSFKSLGQRWPSLLLGIIVVFVFIYITLTTNYRRRRLPPGPRGLPFIGNKHQVPSIKPWRKFEEWNKKYGSVISLHLGKTPVIGMQSVLGTAQAAWDILDRRSDIYSSRPRFVVAGEILSDNKRGLMLPYGEEWRKWRKVLHSGLHARKAEMYTPMQSLESKVTLRDILRHPEDWDENLQRYAASVATLVAYGRRVNSVKEWIVKENMDAMDLKSEVCRSIPGKYLVESWPWLLKLPRALQWFRSEPEEHKQRDIKLYTVLLNEVKKRMAEGTQLDCMATQALIDEGLAPGFEKRVKKDKVPFDELDVAYAVSSPFGAGIETTAGSLATFMLAMVHNPQVMRKAQAELDNVIGQDRLPEFSDKPNLPYIRAVVDETLRWRPVAVLGGTPHSVIADDEYNGMFIPKGSTVFANMAGIMNDPELFPSPDSFIPERFLPDSPLFNPKLHPFDLPFGFGRRSCPGLHLARNSIFINIARILWAFDISPAVDDNGNKVLPDTRNYTNGFNSRPVKFDCNLTPRNEQIAELVMKEGEIAMEELSRYK
ncbi:cytochrome P450 [Panus rudis PR-1116 ss-1]|nr:cytochrome P450 [Panus rudis PR-1116 ss-1]